MALKLPYSSYNEIVQFLCNRVSLREYTKVMDVLNKRALNKMNKYLHD